MSQELKQNFDIEETARDIFTAIKQNGRRGISTPTTNICFNFKWRGQDMAIVNNTAWCKGVDDFAGWLSYVLPIPGHKYNPQSGSCDLWWLTANRVNQLVREWEPDWK